MDSDEADEARAIGVEPGRVKGRVSLFTLMLQSRYVLPREEYWGTGMGIGKSCTVCR
jgi:hypothetical protein